jgi:hypothetical protein
MLTTTAMKAAALGAALMTLAAAPLRADECEAMEKAVQTLINGHDPSSAKGDAPACAAYGYGLGLIKSRRIVADECLDEGDKRTDYLARLDRSIRDIQSEVDKHCQ